MSRPRKSVPDVRFTVGGEGTTSKPAAIAFVISHEMQDDWRRSVPSGVTLEEDHPGHYVMKGVDPAMTRLELTRAFYETFPSDKGWWCKGEDA